MDRVAVFVDAGHLFAAGSAALTGAKERRDRLSLDMAQVVAFLKTRAETLSSVPLLRIYWYDGALPTGLTTEQQRLAHSDHVKLRLGIVNSHGAQKGVDAKIVTDLAELSRNRAICDAVLVGGDEDLRIGVELAQEYGVRVHLLSVEKSAVSTLLRREADTVSEISTTDVASFLTVLSPLPQAGQAAPVPSAAPARNGVRLAPKRTPPAAATTQVVDYPAMVGHYLAQLSDPARVALKEAIVTGVSIPVEHDGKLLAQTRNAICRLLDNEEKNALRRELRRQLGV